jgi:DNA-binding response OmpR family regulator
MLKPTRLLVVDDDPGIRSLLAEYLGPREFEVLTVGTGEQALAQLREAVPDVVILDLDLPESPGIEVLAGLKAAEPALPVLILTGRGDIQTAIRSTELGAFAYLTKPADLGELEVVL